MCERCGLAQGSGARPPRSHGGSQGGSQGRWRTSHRVLRVGPVSARVPVRAAAVAALLAAALLLAVAVDLSRGSAALSLSEVADVLAGGGSARDRLVVTGLRAPRTATAVAVGLLLGASGALSQAFARNPLATPDVLGVDDGAAVGAVAVLAASASLPALAPLAGALGLPLAALAGASLTALAVYLLAWRRGVEGTRLVLVGIGIGAAASGLVSWMLVGARLDQAAAAVRWLSGSLSGRGWEQAAQAGAAAAVLLPLALVLGPRVRALQMGDDVARALGVGLQRSQLAVLAVVVATAALAVTAAGPVGFVAFVAPHLARRAAGASRPPVLAAALVGALLVVVADDAGRTLFPSEVPVGLLTSAVGAPYLVAMLVARTRRRTA